LKFYTVNYTRFYLLLFVTALALVGCGFYQPSEAEVVNIRVEGEDTILNAMVTPYRIALEEEMGTVIAELPEDLSKALPESALGNLVCDLLMEASDTLFTPAPDLAIHNYGGLRVGTLYKGALTRGRMFELLPFENYVVMVTMNGAELRQLCNWIAAYGGCPVAGISMVLEEDLATNIRVQGVSIDDSREYHVVMNDYMANGGDKLFFLKGLPSENSGVLVRDLLIDAIRARSARNEAVLSTIENRITLGH
jgi:2',3'-cyclic-nucleotide 2'-phosphodiesterase (5'-nucleotidase family)